MAQARLERGGGGEMEELNNLVPENFPLFLFNSKGSAKKKMQTLGVGRQIIFICSGDKWERRT